VGAALRVCYDTARASIEQSYTALHWPRQGGTWVDLAEALERFVDLARNSGQLPERMIIRLREILEESLPQDDLTVELRDIIVSCSIETYFKSAPQRSRLGSERVTPHDASADEE